MGEPSFTIDELDGWLRRTAPDDRYRVERVLKELPAERTELVYRRGDPETGPFVRKVFADVSGVGTAYGWIYAAQLAGRRLEHQPSIYECSRDDGTSTVVMEYIPGEDLQRLVARVGPSPQLALEVAIPLCEAVAELHGSFGEPIIHRDIKPSNIMLSGGRLVLIDLGIARTYRPGATGDTTRLGTPGYAPPEQYGYGQTTVRSDVYSLGAVLCFCLTGEMPPSDSPGFPEDDPRIPREFRGVIARAMAFDPKDRYAGARELEAALREVSRLRGRAVAAAEEPGGEPPAPVPPPPPEGDARPAAPPAPGDRPGAASRGGCGPIVRNVAVVAFWALIVSSSVSGMISPTGALAPYPAWYRILGYLTIVDIPATCTAYLLLDREWLQERVSFLRGRSRRRDRFLCWGIIIASVVAFFIATGVYTAV